MPLHLNWRCSGSLRLSLRIGRCDSPGAPRPAKPKGICWRCGNKWFRGHECPIGGAAKLAEKQPVSTTERPPLEQIWILQARWRNNPLSYSIREGCIHLLDRSSGPGSGPRSPRCHVSTATISPAASTDADVSHLSSSWCASRKAPGQCNT